MTIIHYAQDMIKCYKSKVTEHYTLRVIVKSLPCNFFFSITSPQHLKLIKSILGLIYEQEILIKSLVQGVKPSMRDILFFKFNTLAVQDMYKTCTSHVFQHKIADKATSVRLCIDIFLKTLNEKTQTETPPNSDRKPLEDETKIIIMFTSTFTQNFNNFFPTIISVISKIVPYKNSKI